jgi:hypothetical protein
MIKYLIWRIETSNDESYPHEKYSEADIIATAKINGSWNVSVQEQS